MTAQGKVQGGEPGSRGLSPGLRRALEEFLRSQESGHDALRWLELQESRATELNQQLRRQELDFATVLEVANQINARSIDSGGLERFISYVASTIRGQFAVSQVDVLRPAEYGSSNLTLISRSEEPRPVIEFATDGSFGKYVQDLGCAFALKDVDASIQEMKEVRALRGIHVQWIVPLLRRRGREAGDLQGLLCLGERILKTPYTPTELTLLRLLGDMIAVCLHNAQLHHRSITDSLTRVYSRGHFDLHLEAEVSRAERHALKEGGDPRYVSLLILDIDHFKRFNDEHGHLTGDAVLRAVARAVDASVRKSDELARFGGEEFALVAPETRRQEAANLADRIRQAVQASIVKGTDGTPLHVTASVGVATFPTDAATVRELILRADQAMYAAKAAGRNCVRCADSVSTGDGDANDPPA